MMNAAQGGKASSSSKEEWEPFRSFFVALHGSAELDFKPSSMFQGEHFMQASFKQVDLNLREFKVFKGKGANEHEMLNDEQLYMTRINDIKSLLQGSPLTNLINKVPFL